MGSAVPCVVDIFIPVVQRVTKGAPLLVASMPTRKSRWIRRAVQERVSTISSTLSYRGGGRGGGRDGGRGGGGGGGRGVGLVRSANAGFLVGVDLAALVLQARDPPSNSTHDSGAVRRAVTAVLT